MQQQVALSGGSHKLEDGLKLLHIVSDETLNFVCSTFRLFDLSEDVPWFKHFDCFCNGITEVVSASWVCIDVLLIRFSQKGGRFLQESFFIRLKFQEFSKVQTVQSEQGNCMSLQCSIHVFPVEYLCYCCGWVKSSFDPCLVNTTAFHIFTQGSQCPEHDVQLTRAKQKMFLDVFSLHPQLHGHVI